MSVSSCGGVSNSFRSLCGEASTKSGDENCLLPSVSSVGGAGVSFSSNIDSSIGVG
jgi:hypothetical protein